MMRYVGSFFVFACLVPCGAVAAELRCIEEARAYASLPSEAAYVTLADCVQPGMKLTTPVFGAPKATLSSHDTKRLHDWLGQFAGKIPEGKGAVILQWNDPASFTARGKVEDGKPPIIEFKSQM
ncbi:hypothetical protein [Kaistia granuli]|uniref:hypothetical protein n=1 Tax=Kaistia granuli TaxID=363259 RepID=UPI0012EB72F7|nr:hypothetical protein [Kaistia granuli]